MLYLDPKGIIAAILLAGAMFYFFKKKGFEEAAKLFFPNLDELKGNAPNVKGTFIPWLKIAMMSAAGFLLIALADPHQRIYSAANKEKRLFSPKEGIGIYLVLDQSGSMNAQVSLLLQEGQERKMSKMELLKKRAEEFVKSRPNDLIGLVAFARYPTILSPLTINHQVILDKLSSLQVIKDTAEDGTAIGYALYKTANLIVSTQEYYRKEGDLLNAIIILVSDGLQDPNPLDRGHAYRAMELEDAAEFAKKHGIKIYIINIEPRLKEKKFEPNLKQLQRITQMTGGQFFLADGKQGVGTIFQELDDIEKSKIPIRDAQEEYEKRPLFPYIAFIGLCIAFVVFFLQNTYFRQVP